MIKKRSRFWTVIFAFCPGAGHMLNGFIKRGVSFMGIFALLWFLAAWLNIGPIGILTPVVWFYAFFDCINIRFQDDLEFYSQTDDYLFSPELLAGFAFANSSTKLVVGVALVIMGIYALWENVVLYVLGSMNFIPDFIWRIIHSISHIVPQCIVALLIIWAGWRLIRGNKETQKLPEGGVFGNDKELRGAQSDERA